MDTPRLTARLDSIVPRIPSEDLFSSRVSDLGISNNHTVIIYAKEGSFSAPRCWWTFRTFGHEEVHVLDGGFRAWKASGGRWVFLYCCVVKNVAMHVVY